MRQVARPGRVHRSFAPAHAYRKDTLEHRFSIRLESTSGEGHSYSGVIDRLCRSPSGKVSILDYKTGKNVADPTLDLQLQSYAIFAFQHCPVDEIELCYEDLRGITRAQTVIGKDSIVHVVRKVKAKIAAVESAAYFAAKPSILCDWCGYNEMCSSRLRSDAAFVRQSTYAVDKDHDDDSGDTCPGCGADLAEKNGRRGTFIGCTNFPRCRYTRDSW